jgi:hypothetical protein
LLPPGPHQVIQALAALAGRGLGGSECELRCFRRRTVPREVEIRDVPRLAQPPAHVPQGGERLGDRLPQLPSARSPDARRTPAEPARRGRHGPGDPELGFLEPASGHPFAERDVQRVQQADDHAKLQIRPDSRQREQHGRVEDRVPEQPGLDQIGLGESEVRVDGLKVSIVQHRDLYRSWRPTSLQEGAKLLAASVELRTPVPPDRRPTPSTATRPRRTRH